MSGRGIVMKELIGRITNIQNYSVHDGPNIRTLVFMKGCPLRCLWCSNPETQEMEQNLAYSPVKCIGCGACVQKCRLGVIALGQDRKLNINFRACSHCFDCIDTCYAQALHVFGEDVTVDELLRRTKKRSGWRADGGVTVSGGEPLAQADFVAEFLRRNRATGTHTAIETSGCADWASLEKVARQCRLIFFDIKMMDRKKHRKYTGVDNSLILSNLRRLSEAFPDVDLIVRTPVIPGINDSRQELTAILDFLATLPHLTDYELLPYHGFGAPKYAQIGKTYELEGLQSLGRDSQKELNESFRKILHLTSSGLK